MKVTIVAPDGVVYSEETLNITLPGADGEFGVYPNHAPLLSLLNAGVIEIVDLNQNKEYVAIDWGYAKIDGEKVDILVHGAFAINQDGKIAESIKKAKSLLESASSDKFLLAGAFSKLECLITR